MKDAIADAPRAALFQRRRRAVHGGTLRCSHVSTRPPGSCPAFPPPPPSRRLPCARHLQVRRPVTLIPGDGIGPEISEAVKTIYKVGNVRLLAPLAVSFSVPSPPLCSASARPLFCRSLLTGRRWM